MGKTNVFSNPDIKEEMLNLRKHGHPYQYLAEKYGVSYACIVYHCKAAGITNKSLIIKKSELKRDNFKIDEHGVEWRKDGSGDWICVGRTKEQRKIAALREKKKALEEKRLQILTY